jgi:large subunit ribosomal protein L1
MAKLSKRVTALRATVDRAKLYPVDEAIGIVKTNATAKFNESIDVAINLGVDAKKSDQVVRGSVVLPRGTGKSVRVAVFAQGEAAKAALAAGAELVGMEDLAEQVKGGTIDFDVCIAAPDAMRVVGALGQILAEAVKNAKAGQVQYRTDKGGIIQCTIGRASFESAALRENLLALIDALNKARPAAAKGIYLRKMSISSTMGVGVRVDQSSLQQQA